jgi:hypothetical protein
VFVVFPEFVASYFISSAVFHTRKRLLLRTIGHQIMLPLRAELHKLVRPKCWSLMMNGTVVGAHLFWPNFTVGLSRKKGKRHAASIYQPQE